MSRSPLWKRLSIAAVIALSLLPSLTAHAAPPGEEAVLRQARELLAQEEPPAVIREAAALLAKYETQYANDPDYLLALAEANYRLADPAGDIDKEYPKYEKAEGYAKSLLKIAPDRPEGHYWYGLSLLKKAHKTGGISAYFYAKNGIKELEIVRRASPSYDHGGASRVLGLLYCLAPGWSPFGDIDKSVRLAEEATRIDPSYPLNRLYLADAYLKQGNREAAAREYRKLLASPPRRGESAKPYYRERAKTVLASLSGNCR